MQTMFLLIQNTMNTGDTSFTDSTTPKGSEAEKFDLYDDYEQVYLEWWINTFVYITIVCGLRNILTFMHRGFRKDVSTFFYMSILTLADSGK